MLITCLMHACKHTHTRHGTGYGARHLESVLPCLNTDCNSRHRVVRRAGSRHKDVVAWVTQHADGQVDCFSDTQREDGLLYKCME